MHLLPFSSSEKIENVINVFINGYRFFYSLNFAIFYYGHVDNSEYYSLFMDNYPLNNQNINKAEIRHFSALFDYSHINIYLK